MSATCFSQPPDFLPIHSGPSAKEKRYDRQLRLWAASGQTALESAHILLVNGDGPGVVGVETLKNLVLPGIGAFTVLDSATISPPDLGVNFFLTRSSVGKARAEETCRLLCELNPDVTGHAVCTSARDFLTPQTSASTTSLSAASLEPYSHFLLVAPLDPEILTLIADYAFEHNKPAFYVHSVGFYASFRLVLPPAFPVADTHPDPAATQDLRLAAPWPELEAFAAERVGEGRLEAMDDADHGHVPWVVIMLEYLRRWRKERGEGSNPRTYKEKGEFKSFMMQGMRTASSDGVEENWEEAAAAVLKSLGEGRLSSGAREVYDAEECENLTGDSPAFWLIVHAIRTFYRTHSALPLPGSLPDMKARSANYVALQHVYKAKARKDRDEVLATVRALESRLGGKVRVDEKDVDAFCKNAAHVRVVRGKRLCVVSREGVTKELGEDMRGRVREHLDPSSQLPLHMAFLAYDHFTATTGRAPGSSSLFEQDSSAMTAFADQLVQALLETANDDGQDNEHELAEAKLRVHQRCREITRSGGAELHNTAALAGGLVAQEVIKVVTGQYLPIDNTCLFDGVKSESGVLRL